MKATIIINDPKLLTEVRKYADRIGVAWQTALAKTLATGASRKLALRRYGTSAKGRRTRKRYLDRLEAKDRRKREERLQLARTKAAKR